MPKSELQKAVDDATVRLTGKKYCQSCRMGKNIEGGKDIFARGRKYGWRCIDCVTAQKKHAK